MIKKIYKSILLASFVVLASCLVFFIGILYDYYGDVQKSLLQSELTLAARGVEASGEAYLEDLPVRKQRFTYIAPDGEVLFDTARQAEELENHGDREEVREAMEDGRGESLRYSKTLLETMTYYAVRLDDDHVLRVSGRQISVFGIILSLIQPILLIVVVVLILSYALAHRIAHRIVDPLNDLDLDQPLENDTYDELAPFLTRIDMQQEEIRKQKTVLAEKRKEFQAVTENMREGMILLDTKDVILSINPAAEVFFDTTDACVGKPFLQVERDRDIYGMVEALERSGAEERQIEREGSHYLLRGSMIRRNGEKIGKALLVMDITEKMESERLRREFTANVTHELKTPLHTIMGNAELIESGLVPTDKIGEFAGNIRNESGRLYTLIEDVLRLSKLDESVEMERERVELRSLSEDILRSLQPLADSRSIGLKIRGAEEAEVETVPSLIREILYNLCDNAIKYNREHGSVILEISIDDKEARVEVSDTGIGIAREHQSRVFERFYRVDKGRSREVGGTGLGLSIVKHAVSYLGGNVFLKSEPGEGTSITVGLPR